MSLFETLDQLFDDVEYRLGNFFDPPGKFIEGKDNTETWCQRITAKQACRYAKYMYKNWNRLAFSVKDADLSVYKLKKDRRLVEKLRKAILDLHIKHEDLYRRMLRRKIEEDSRNN